MKNARPRIFIGSSSEGLTVAEALQLNLDHDAEVTIWSQGVFGLSGGSLETLVKALPSFDFAILVLTPDDLTESRGDTQPSPRDNVLFELGLFIGHLGRERCFIVFDRTKKLKLPSDLAGITPADFQLHSDGNLQASVGSASTRIKNIVLNLGSFSSEGESLIDAKVQYQVLADLLEFPALQFFILMRECGTTLTQESAFMIGPRYEYHEPTKGHGHGWFSIKQLCGKLADAGLLQVDLRGRVSLTARGEAFAEWLSSSGFKASYFWSDNGGWGNRPAALTVPHAKNFPISPNLHSSNP